MGEGNAGMLIETYDLEVFTPPREPEQSDSAPWPAWKPTSARCCPT
jgi:hypothetical protein